MTFSAEEVSKFPPPGMDFPTSFTFDSDGDRVLFLRTVDSLTAAGVKGLYSYDIREGRETLIADQLNKSDAEESLEEQLRKQRQRQMSTGITSYMWSSTGKLLIPSGSDIYILDSLSGVPRLLVSSEHYSCVDPKLSPDGELVSFVSNGEIYLVDINGGSPRQLTVGDSGKTRGLADYIAQEEMQRGTGYWWSKDSSYIAFTEVDERMVSKFNIAHIGKDSYGPEVYEQHRYPFAGDINPDVKLGVIQVSSGDIRWINTDKYEYIARIDWLDDQKLFVQLQDRSQKNLQVSCFDVTDLLERPILSESSDNWINLHNMFRPVDGNRFIWASERSGFMHLYLYSVDGTLIRQITSGEWQVDAVASIDRKTDKVYFMATLEDAKERHLYRIDFDGTKLEKLTSIPGVHSVFMNVKSDRFVDIYHSLVQPPSINICSVNTGAIERNIFLQDYVHISGIDLKPPEMISLITPEGTELFGAIYKPDKQYGDGPFPTVVSVYGGPHAQMVTNGWNMTVAMRAQYLREKGFLVFVLDNRGSSRRGATFESVIKGNMGNLEVEDQEFGLNWLISQGLADKNRIGIYGWSYGGYMALMCLAKKPNLFKCAVAGAPVTSWDGYDTHYTERYMGTPEENRAGYEKSNVMAHVKNIEGELLLVHGLIDENVHFRHTARLINSLISENKSYNLLIFPDERHMPRRQADRAYMETQIADFFLKSLT